MGRYILRFVGKGPMPTADLEQLRSVPGMNVLDASSPKMLLVLAPGERLRPVVKSLHDWVLAEETTVPLPDVRVKVRAVK